MANGGQRRTRSERVAALELPPGHWERAWLGLWRPDVLSRMALALVAAVAVCAIIQAWDPPRHWRTGMVPTRYVTARVEFKQENKEETEQAQRKAREETKAIFKQDKTPLVQLRAKLRTTIADLTKADTLTPQTQVLWEEFQPPLEKGSPAQASGTTGQFSGISQGPGRQGQARPTRPGGRRGLCLAGTARPIGGPAEKTQGFQPEDD